MKIKNTWCVFFKKNHDSVLLDEVKILFDQAYMTSINKLKWELFSLHIYKVPLHYI